MTIAPPPLDSDPHLDEVLRVARRRGLEIQDLRESWRLDAAQIRKADRTELVIHGRIFSSLAAPIDRLCDNKEACKSALESLGIPTPAGISFGDPRAERAQLDALLDGQRPFVVKPIDGTGGDGVVTGLTDPDELTQYWKRWSPRYSRFIVEEEVPGQDLRLQAVGGRLVAACVREPAHVVGDGMRTVLQLVEARRNVMRRQNPANRLEIDDEALGWLTKQGLELADVPEPGRGVRLRTVANIGAGGVPLDVTDDLHPRYGDWIGRIAGELGLRIFALDVMTIDRRAEPMSASRALEINARPEWLHHTFSEGRTHDIASLILDDLFR